MLKNHNALRILQDVVYTNGPYLTFILIFVPCPMDRGHTYLVALITLINVAYFLFVISHEQKITRGGELWGNLWKIAFNDIINNKSIANFTLAYYNSWPLIPDYIQLVFERGSRIQTKGIWYHFVNLFVCSGRWLNLGLSTQEMKALQQGKNCDTCIFMVGKKLRKFYLSISEIYDFMY